MTRRQKRLIIIISVLLLILLALAGYFAYYKTTRKLTFNISAPVTGAIEPPEYLFSFSGEGKERLQRPIGIMTSGGEVFVVDSLRHKIDVFNENGQKRRSFAATEAVTPLYIAKNPKTGNIYVTDRRTRSVHIYAPDGKYLQEFNPNLPKNELPKFDTQGAQWAPVAIAFADDGTLYVTDILKGHRLLIFDKDGKFQKSVGTVGIVLQAQAAPAVFQFPNGLEVHKGEVWVADSNNRRIQVFDKNGEFKRIIVTQGLPRGLVYLNRFPADEAKTPDRFVVVDTLSHDATIWTQKGDKVLSFGEQGILDGQFSYPNAIAKGKNNRMFITDTANGRVQVWGWPALSSPVPTSLPKRWWLCLLPLLLLPLLLLLRRKRFFATADFVQLMVQEGDADQMPHRRRRWLITEAEYEAIKGLAQGDVDMGQLFEPAEYSESDVNALMEKLEIDHELAVKLSLAQRAHVFCTQNDELRRLAKILEVDVVNRVEFLDRFGDKDRPTPGSPVDDGGPAPVSADAPQGTGGGVDGAAPGTTAPGPLADDVEPPA